MDDLPGPTKIRIIGINVAGAESGNPFIIVNCTIPWLQDVAPPNSVWTSWGGVQRQIQILNTFNVKVATFDTLLKPLGTPPNSNYDDLKSLLKTIAGE